MYIKQLKLFNYRNYQSLDISFNKKMNVIIGKNAQGKTNLLESIYFLSLARSFRTNEERTLIKYENEFSDISCLLSENDQDKYLRSIIYQKGKSFFIGKTIISKVSDFIGQLNVVLFSPEDLYLFSQAPRYRRRFIDQELSKLSKKYFYHLNCFHKILKERNNFLKNNFVDEKMMDVFDFQLVGEEYEIIKLRSSFIEYINCKIKDLFYEISGMNLNVEIEIKHGIETSEMSKECLLKEHYKSRYKDFETHTTNVGIHHADIKFLFDGKNILWLASQGQKRLVMIAFKLSLLKYIEFISKRKAIVLLDDVLSELDIEKQNYLIKKLDVDYQCFITTTNWFEKSQSKERKIIVVANGEVQL